MTSLARPGRTTRLAVLALLAVGPTAAAQTTWTGGAGSGSWNAAGNCSNGVPVGSTSTAVILAGTTQLATTQDIPSPPLVLNSLTFAAGAGAFTVGGNGLRFDGTSPTLTQSSASNQQVTAPVIFNTAGSITGAGAGTLTLSSLAVNNGTLTVGRAVTVGTLTLGSANGTAVTVDTGANALTLTGNLVFNAQFDAGFNPLTPPAAVGGQVVLTAGQHEISGSISSAAASPFIDLTISAVLSGSGGLTKKADGTGNGALNLRLTGQNTYTGPTVMEASAGIIYLGATNALPAASAVTLATGSVIKLKNTDAAATSFSQSIGSLAGTGGVVEFGTSTLTVGNDNTSTAFGGTLIPGVGGTGAVVKVGTGVQTFSSTGNTYSGGTTINGGTLRLANASGSAVGSGLVTVNNTGTLAGGTGVTGGRAGGAVTVAAGGTVRPGHTGVGRLITAGNVTLSAATSAYRWNVAGTAPETAAAAGTAAASFLQVGGTLGLPAGGGFTLVIDGTVGSYAAATTYPIASFTGLTGGTFNASAFTVNTANFTSPTPGTWAVALDNPTTPTQLLATFTPSPVPEPATALLTAAAGLGLGWGVRRRRRG